MKKHMPITRTLRCRSLWKMLHGCVVTNYTRCSHGCVDRWLYVLAGLAVSSVLSNT